MDGNWLVTHISDANKCTHNSQAPVHYKRSKNCVYKKFELMLRRRAKAYSSSGSVVT